MTKQIKDKKQAKIYGGLPKGQISDCRNMTGASEALCTLGGGGGGVEGFDKSKIGYRDSM